MNTLSVYMLLNDRRAESLQRLLRHFAPYRIRCTDEYEYPQYHDKPECVYFDDASLMAQLEVDEHASYIVYWNVEEQDSEIRVEQTIANYTDDGGVIFGIVVSASDAMSALEQLSRMFGARWGLVTGDECPPMSASQFRQLCREATLPRIVDGILLGTDALA